MEKFKIVSPMRGERYTAEEVLGKLMVRQNFSCAILVTSYEGVYEYGSDHDGHIHLTAESVDSAWTESVNCKLLADIPFHRSGAGKYTFGSWESRSESGEDPEYRKNPMVVSVTASLNNEEDTISFVWDSRINNDDAEQDKVQDLLEKILREAIVQIVFSKGFPEEIKEGLAADVLPVEELCQSEGCNYCTGVHAKCRLNTVNDEGYVVDYYQDVK